MEAVELRLNATYYVQYYALKSVDEKSQSLMGGKLFFFYRTVFELAQGLRNSKISVMNCSYEALVQKEALVIFHDGYLDHFYMFYHQYHQF